MAKTPAHKELTFGQKIVATREAMGLSQADFARKVGVDRQLMGQWEQKARCSIHAEKLNALVAATGKPSTYWTGKEYSGTPLVDELEDSLTELTAHTDGEAKVDNPIARTALSLLMKLPTETALETIEEAATLLAERAKKTRQNPTRGA